MATAFNDMTRSLRNQAERLNASYRRFATVTQSARDAIISTDELNNITFWNRSADATFGYTETVLGRPIVNLIVESDRAAYKAAAATERRRSDIRAHHRSDRHAQGRHQVSL